MTETGRTTTAATERPLGRLDWVRRGLKIARMSSRRQIRRLLANPRSTAVKVLVYVGIWLALRQPWNAEGGTPRGTESIPVGTELLPAFRGGFTLVWLGLCAFGFLAATTDLDDLEVGPAVVRVAGIRATVFGRLLFEHARRLVIIGVLVVIELASIVFGGGGSLTFVLGLAGFIGLEITAGLTGEILALGYAAITRRNLVGEYLPFAVFGVWAAAVFVVSRWTEQVIATAASLPTGWYADLLFLGSPVVDADPRLAAGAVAFSVVGAAVLFSIEERLAARVWFDPRGRSEDDEQTAADVATTSAGLPATSRRLRSLAGVAPVSPAARAIAWRVTTRVARQPSTLYLLSLPVIMALALLFSEHGHAWYPVGLAVLGGWTAGTGITLNPLSSEGVGLPGLLTAPVAGRDLLAGYVVTGVALAVPAVVAGPLGIALYHGIALAAVAQAVFLGLVVAVVGATVAFAVGIGIPRFEAMTATEADAPMPPAQVTIIVYSVIFLAVAAPGTLGLLVDGTYVSIDPTAAAVAGVGGTLLLGGAAAAAAAGYATRRLDSYELSA